MVDEKLVNETICNFFIEKYREKLKKLGLMKGLAYMNELLRWNFELYIRIRRLKKYNGWIKTEERLPDEEEMKRAYCRIQHGSEFIVMIEGADKPTTLYRTLDGFWMDDESNTYKVIAWQPLPDKFEN